MFGFERLKERVNQLEQREEDTLKVVNAFFGYDGICFPKFKSEGDALCYAFDKIKKMIEECRPSAEPDYCSMINRLEEKIKQQDEEIKNLKEAVEVLLKDRASEIIDNITSMMANEFDGLIKNRKHQGEKCGKFKCDNNQKNKNSKKRGTKNVTMGD